MNVGTTGMEMKKKIFHTVSAKDCEHLAQVPCIWSFLQKKKFISIC